MYPVDLIRLIWKRLIYHDLTYCEFVSIQGLFLTEALNYHSAGGIIQDDTEQPDSMVMEVSSSGNGFGSIAAGS